MSCACSRCSSCSADQHIAVYLVAEEMPVWIKANDVKVKDGGVSFRYLGKEIAYFPCGAWRGFIYDGYRGRI